ncbi:MAG: hypothetical protein LBU62_10995 [Bacteroidales bacterium]|jgi:hypothetical protein|nr:hypothetical protein [Bacteroidales bacterium]
MKRIFVISMACVFAGSVFAQTQTEEKKPQAGTPSAAIADIRLANELAKYGYAHNEALPLIQAAEILLSTPTQVSKLTKTDEGSKPETVKEKTTGVPHKPDVLLADAKELAQSNAHLLALVKNAEAKLGQKSRGRVGGPGYKASRLYANRYELFQAKFWQDDLAEILVTGDGDTDLDLYVYDENDNLITRDEDYTDDCYVRWYPKWTGVYTLKIVNRGKVYNDYELFTN